MWFKFKLVKLKSTIVSLLLFLTFASSYLVADSHKIEAIGPGVWHHDIYLDQGPWAIHVLEIEITNPFIDLETIKAANRLEGREETSVLARSVDAPSHWAIGAINGDFFSADGVPVGTQVTKGTIVCNPINRSAFGITMHKNPFINILYLNALVTAKNRNSHIIAGINSVRSNGAMILYNRFKGSRTGTNQWGVEALVQLLEDFAVNDTIVGVISEIDTIAGNNLIPQAGFVLSGHDESKRFIVDNFEIGDTIQVFVGLSPENRSIKEVVGGVPRIIRDGKISVENIQEGVSDTFAKDRHPRTAVGFSVDSSKVYFVTVDGRQPGYSVGMSLFELADFMVNFGIYQGVNLDGGGSTTMIVRNQVVNRPSDTTGERPVANALLVISSAPLGELSVLKIQPQDLLLVAGQSKKFTVQGFDQFYNPVTVHQDSLVWSCDQYIGSINADGFFTAADIIDSGFVFVQLNQIKDSTKVYVVDVEKIILLPNPIILQIGQSQQVEVTSEDYLGRTISLLVTDYEWSVSNEIGEVTSYGLFTAMNQGDGYVIAQYQAVAGSSFVRVGSSSSTLLEDFNDLSEWYLSGVRVNLSECYFIVNNNNYHTFPSSGELKYSLEKGGTSALYCNTSINISGEPTSVGLWIYGDGHGHWLRGEFEDKDGEIFLINFTESTPGINWNNEWRYLEIPFSKAIPSWANPNAILNFPITWKKIYLAETNENAKNQGIIYIDDLYMNYIIDVREKDGLQIIPQQNKLERVYPNPFNEAANIQFALKESGRVKIILFNLLGQKVEEILDTYYNSGRHRITFHGENISSGIYLCQMRINDFIDTEKFIYLK